MTSTTTRLIANTDRLHATFETSRYVDSTTWGAMSAGGGKLVRTTAGDTHVIATVGPDAGQLAKHIATIDLSPAVFLHSLGVALDGRSVDMPRLVRDVLAGRDVDVPDCHALTTLTNIRETLTGAKPGAAAAVTQVVTDRLDQFGPTLVPAQVAWFIDEDYHTHREWVDLSVALAPLEAGDVLDLIDALRDLGSATLPSAAIATLTSIDRSFDEDMSSANWETVEVIADEQTIRVLTDVLRREHPEALDEN